MCLCSKDLLLSKNTGGAHVEEAFRRGLGWNMISGPQTLEQGFEVRYISILQEDTRA